MFNTLTLKLCLKAQAQAVAAFCWALLHHYPVSIYNPKEN
jgi:hypothetical protein